MKKNKAYDTRDLTRHRDALVSKMRQAQIQATDALMVEQEFVDGPVESWLASFVAWAANNTEFRCS